MIRIGFLASHNGTAFRILMERNETESLGIVPSVVITNNPDADVLKTAERFGVPSCVINKNTVGEDNIDQSICDCLIRHNTGLVIMAGYMKKVGLVTLGKFNKRILNSHPALLPKFGGQGMYGRRVHEAVIAAKEKESGVTVHLIDKEYDTGPIVTQVRIVLRPDETVESLEERIKALEVDAYIEAIRKLSSPLAGEELDATQ